jgi:hypothetical protein
MAAKDTQREGESSPVNTTAPQVAEKGPTFAQSETPVADLTSEILQALPRARGERVTCRRITGNHYRCNWWCPQSTDEYDNPGMTGMTVTTHRVRRSEMLHVTQTAKGLVMLPVSNPGANEGAIPDRRRHP